MRAIVYSKQGPSSVLQLAERPVPEPGPGQVRVRMVRAGVNPTDWKSRAGTARPLAFDEVTPRPGRRGRRRRGRPRRVVAGARPAGLALPGPVRHPVRDRGRVLRARRQPGGAAAGLVPDDVAFDLGASLGVPAITAHRALTRDAVARLGPGTLSGRVVLAQGGAGAVGNAAIQLAVWSGATVISTISSDAKAALATAAGAAPRGQLPHRGRRRGDPRAGAGRRRHHRGGLPGPQQRPRRGRGRQRRHDRGLRQQRRRHVPGRHPADLRRQPGLPVPAALHPGSGAARRRRAGRGRGHRRRGPVGRASRRACRCTTTRSRGRRRRTTRSSTTRWARC